MSEDYKKTLDLHIVSNKSGHNVLSVPYIYGNLIQSNLSFTIDDNHYHLSPENTDDAQKMIQFLQNWIEQNKPNC